MLMINRYVIKLRPSIFKQVKIGNIIMSDAKDSEDVIPVGFIGDIFNKTKSVEICLFKPLDLDTLKVDKKRILYYENNYDSRKRFNELKKQGH
jgi:hypothetical protein